MFSFTIGTRFITPAVRARCLGPVELKHNFFFERISLRSGVPHTNSYSLDL